MEVYLVVCPNCGSKLRVIMGDSATATVTCPRCGAQFAVARPVTTGEAAGDDLKRLALSLAGNLLSVPADELFIKTAALVAGVVAGMIGGVEIVNAAAERLRHLKSTLSLLKRPQH